MKTFKEFLTEGKLNYRDESIPFWDIDAEGLRGSEPETYTALLKKNKVTEIEQIELGKDGATIYLIVKIKGKLVKGAMSTRNTFTIGDVIDDITKNFKVKDTVNL